MVEKLSRRGRLIMTLIFGVFFFSGCTPGATVAVAPKLKVPTHEEKLQSYVQSLPLEVKVGQMLFVGIPGTDYDETASRLVEECHVGGVIHFDRNLISSGQVQDLNNKLQVGAKSKGQGIPLFIAVDQEGGQVARMRQSLVVAPSAASLGEVGEPEEVKLWAVKTAQSLKNHGFNTNFAPVADLGLTNRRSYGSTAETVTPMVEAALKGYEEAKLQCAIKHFPGIGKMLLDPHEDTSAINISRQELEAMDMAPFLAMVNKRPPRSYMIMVSHLVYPAFSKEPASVAPELLTEVLRKQWRYEGIIITDDMAMGGLSKVYSSEVMGIKAVDAGVDILLSCGADPTMSYTIYREILNAAKAGRISSSRLDASVMRILAAKEAIGLWQLP